MALQFPSAESQDLKQLVERLVQIFTPEEIYLFGSVARGQAGEHSDYDLLVVVRDSDEPGYRRAMRAHRGLVDIPVAADVVVLTRREFDGKRGVIGSLPEAVLYEGKLVFAA